MLSEYKRRIVRAIIENLTKNAGPQPPILRVIQGKKENNKQK